MHTSVISGFLLASYTALLVKVMVFKDMPLVRVGQLMLNFGGTDAGHAPNFIPFATIWPYLMGSNGLMIGGINLVGNVALLVPVGFLVPFIYRGMTWKKAVLLGVASGLAIEVLQTVLRVGIFDIDDVILNALGVVLGYIAHVLLMKWLHEKKYILIGMAALIGLIAALGTLYAVYPHGQPVQTGIAAGPEGFDLCGGTGGTGEIVGQEDNTIALKRNDGVVQTITLTNKTAVRTAKGPATPSDLATGDRVTVVIDESETASTVLVCGMAD